MAFVSHISVFGRLHFTLVSSVTDKKPLPVAVTPVRTNRCHMVCSSAPQDMKFTYFDIRGGGEACRLAMVIGGLDFEDVRVKSDEWPTLKPKTPYLSLPLISIDGVEYAQSQAILKYIGKLTGLYPTDPKDALLVDEVAYTLIDMARGFFPILGNKSLSDDEKSGKVLELVDRYWGGVEKRLQKAAVANDGPFILGEQVSVADLGLVNTYNGFKTDLNNIVSDEVLAKYPRMLQIAEGVMNLPAIKEWYQKHPLKPQFAGR